MLSLFIVGFCYYFSFARISSALIDVYKRQALSFVTMCFVRHGDTKAEAKKGLDAFEDMDT